MYGIFSEDNSGTSRMIAYSHVEYSSSPDAETVVETTEEKLSDAFENAGVDELAGAGEPIEAAIDDPLRYYDYLILENDEIVFDEGYAREGEE